MSQNKSLVGTRPTVFVCLSQLDKISDYICDNYLRRKSAKMNNKCIMRILAVLAYRKLQLHNSTPYAVSIDSALQASLGGVPGLVNSIYAALPTNGVGKAKQHNYLVTLNSMDRALIESYIDLGQFLSDLDQLKTFAVSHNIGLDQVNLVSGVVPTSVLVVDETYSNTPTLPCDIRPIVTESYVSKETLKLISESENKALLELVNTIKKCKTNSRGYILETKELIQECLDAGITVRTEHSVINANTIDIDDYVFHTVTPVSQVAGQSLAHGFTLPLMVYSNDKEDPQEFDLILGTTNVLKDLTSLDLEIFVGQSLTVLSNNFYKDVEAQPYAGKTQYSVPEKVVTADPSRPTGNTTVAKSGNFIDKPGLEAEQITSAIAPDKPRQGGMSSGKSPLANPPRKPQKGARGRGNQENGTIPQAVFTQSELQAYAKVSHFLGLSRM